MGLLDQPSEHAELVELRERVKNLEQQLSRLLASQSCRSSSAGAGPSATGERLSECVAATFWPEFAGSCVSCLCLFFAPATTHVEPLPETVAMGATRIVMHQIVAPSEVDALGICFGGQVGNTIYSIQPAPCPTP
jgi:hypothetical protein